MVRIPLEVGPIHFVGIGGIGMSGLAEVLDSLGYKVRGSDISESYNTERLKGKGIDIVIGHDGKNVVDASVVVTSTAVKIDNPEVIEARKRMIPVVKRAEMLAELMRLKVSIAVAGTHGKTTTTSMVAAALEGAGMDPTVINGGIINSYGTNVRLGNGEWMVVEADESDGTFLKIPSTVAIITNIDPEHLDYWGSFENLKAAFKSFVENIPFYGFAVLCIDHPLVQELAAGITDRRVITYGLSPQSDVRASNVTTSHLGSRFDVQFSDYISKGAGQIKSMQLSVLGMHNVVNSLAAIAVAKQLGVENELIKKGLGAFSGVKRRFTVTGNAHGVTVVDDYAHHPAEIVTTLKAARDFAKKTEDGKVIVVVQPHRYTRLRDLFNDFCAAFNDADTVIVLEVYSAGEKPIEGFDHHTLAEGIRGFRHKNVIEQDDATKLPDTVASIAKAGDVVICMGAGSVTYMARELPEKLEDIFSSTSQSKTA